MQLIIRMALENFPERRRRIFEMSRFNNMSNQEIALSLHLSVRTIEHQIYLSLQVLKRIIFNFIFPVFSLSSWNVSIVIYEISKSNIMIT